MSDNSTLTGVSRRELLCAGGAVFLARLVSGLVGAVGAARAAGVNGPVPEVDQLALRVVIDSYHLAIAPNARLGNVTVERVGMPAAGRSLLGEFGLSLHVESRRGTETRNMLVDFGFTPEALNNNLSVLGISPSQLDALILSHGHYDHFGGLVGFLRENSGRLRAGLPLYLGGEECFCTREWVLGQPQDFGSLDRHALAEASLKVTFAEGPSLVADHGFTTGQIPESSFEKVLAPTRMTVGVHDGIGCHPEGLSAEKRTAHTIPDDFQHEIATCFNVKGRGLVVLTSCSHRGVVNTVKQAMAVSGVKKVHAVAGGFHLAPQPEDYVRETVAALKELNPDYVIPMHCTGDKFIELVQKEMPDKFIRSYNGSRYTFGV